VPETDWYLIDRSGRRYGPYERALVERLAAQRELRPATPVWHPGLARWQRADQVMRLPPEPTHQTAAPAVMAAPRPASAPPRRAAAPTLTPKPVAAPARAGGAVPKARVARVGTPITPPQALQRILAALFDALCVYVAFRLFVTLLPERAPPLRGPLLFIVWALLDAAFISRLGSTPGKALFAVRVRGPQDERLEYPRALGRSAVVPLLLLMLVLKSGFLTVLGFGGLVLAGLRMRGGFGPWWDDVAGVRVGYGEFTTARRAMAIVAFAVLILVALVIG
jgi:hypothetical protein